MGVPPTQWMLPAAAPGPVAAIVGPRGPTDPDLITLPSDLSALLGGSQTLTEALAWLAQNGGGSPSPILRQLAGNIVISSAATGALSVQAAEQILLTGAISSATAATGSLTIGSASSIALVRFYGLYLVPDRSHDAGEANGPLGSRLGDFLCGWVG